MDDAILSLREASKEQVVDYLGRRGMSAEIVEWKYFDRNFNQGRERGYVWTRAGQIEGFIGLIPWSVRSNNEQIEMVWGCDWSVANPNTSQGMGMVLATHAMSLHRPWMSLGGSEKARTIMPHLSNHVVNDAGLVFWQPLRLGAALKKLGERSRLASWLERTPFRSIPVRWIAGSSCRRPTIITEQGLPTAVAELIEHDHHDGWHPYHRSEALQWSMARCPSISLRTCFVPGLSGIDAAAVFWSSTNDSDFWKVALWSAPLRESLIPPLLSEVQSQVYDAGGLAISTLASHLQESLIEQLRASGYWQQPRPLPLYLLGQRKQPLPFGDMTGLSYVCTDLAYRF